LTRSCGAPNIAHVSSLVLKHMTPNRSPTYSPSASLLSTWSFRAQNERQSVWLLTIPPLLLCFYLRRSLAALRFLHSQMMFKVVYLCLGSLLQIFETARTTSSYGRYSSTPVPPLASNACSSSTLIKRAAQPEHILTTRESVLTAKT
jgi:hypothetical protein